MDEQTLSMRDFFDVVESYISNPTFNGGRVVKYNCPDDLHQKVDLSIKEHGEGFDAMVSYAKQYFEFCVNTGSKQFLNQLYQGFNLPAFMGDIVSMASNTTMATFEVAPLATEIERELIRLMNSYTGYTNGDGIFLTGGSNANLIAMFSARNRAYPEGRAVGMDSNLKLRAYVNENAHYSFDTAANLLGIGAGNIVKVKANSIGSMIPEDFASKVEADIVAGNKPFFVASTAGTTVHGAFDPIEALIPICRKYNIWLHVDGAFGGSLILSPKFKHFFRGIEHSDSFTWDAHKVMNVPLMCSVILVKEEGVLKSNIVGTNTDYIYHSNDDSVDLGQKSIQCGRRVDAVKLWFAWKYYGKEGYAKRVENVMELAQYAEDIVKAEPQLELIAPRQSLNICFRYIPKIKVNLNEFNLKVRETLRKSGGSMVNYSHIGDALAIRLVIANGSMDRDAVEKFFGNFMEVAKLLEQDISNA